MTILQNKDCTLIHDTGKARGQGLSIDSACLYQSCQLMRFSCTHKILPVEEMEPECSRGVSQGERRPLYRIRYRCDLVRAGSSRQHIVRLYEHRYAQVNDSALNTADKSRVVGAALWAADIEKAEAAGGSKTTAPSLRETAKKAE